MTKIRLLLFVIVLIVAWSSIACPEEKISLSKVGILPFEIYSQESLDYLKEIIWEELSSQIGKKSQIELIDSTSIKKALGNRHNQDLNKRLLEDIAKAINADFLVFGSLSKIKDRLSFDAHIFNNWKEEYPLSQSFVEGNDLDELLKELGQRVRLRIVKMSAEISPSRLAAKSKMAAAPEEESFSFADPPLSPSLETGVEQKEPRSSSLAEKVEKVDNLLQEKRKKVAEEKAPITAASQIFSTENIPKEKLPALKEKTAADEAPQIFSSPQVSSVPKTLEDNTFPFLGKSSDSNLLKKSSKPINITSNTFKADNKKRLVVFIGNVVAKRDDMAIYADSMWVHYDEKGELKKIVARQNVKISQGERIATCQEVVFFSAEQKIVLKGSPSIWQGKNFLSGEEITIFLEEDISIVRGSKNYRVKAVFYPQEDEDRTTPE